MGLLTLSLQTVGPWALDTVRFEQEQKGLGVPVFGLIGNSITTSDQGRRRTIEWKRKIVATTKSLRSATQWDPRTNYSVSVGFSFYPPAHGNRQLDAENFIKPALDALAAGLFCSNEQEPDLIVRFDFDDSNFSYLFVHKLADARHEGEEGAAFFVSVAAQ